MKRSAQPLTAWKEKVRQLKTSTYALALAYRDPRTPWYASVFAGVVVAYALSPIDLIPDFIPILGYLDDLVLVPLGISLALKMIPPAVMSDCRERAAAELAQGGRPGKRFNGAAVVIIIALWLLALAAVVMLLVRLLRD